MMILRRRCSFLPRPYLPPQTPDQTPGFYVDSSTTNNLAHAQIDIWYEIPKRYIVARLWRPQVKIILFFVLSVLFFNFNMVASAQELEITCEDNGILTKYQYNGTSSLFKHGTHRADPSQAAVKAEPLIIGDNKSSELIQKEQNKPTDLTLDSPAQLKENEREPAKQRQPQSEDPFFTIEYPYKGFTKTLLNEKTELIKTPFVEMVEIALSNDLDPFMLSAIMMAEEMPIKARYAYAKLYYESYGIFPTDGRPAFSRLKCSLEKPYWGELRKDFPKSMNAQSKLKSYSDKYAQLHKIAVDASYKHDPYNEKVIILDQQLEPAETGLVTPIYYYSLDQVHKLEKAVQTKNCENVKAFFADGANGAAKGNLDNFKCRKEFFSALQTYIDYKKTEATMIETSKKLQELEKTIPPLDDLDADEKRLALAMAECRDHCYGILVPQTKRGFPDANQLPKYKMTLSTENKNDNDEMVTKLLCSRSEVNPVLNHGTAAKWAPSHAYNQKDCCFHFETNKSLVSRGHIQKYANTAIGLGAFKDKVYDNLAKDKSSGKSLAYSIQRWNGLGTVGGSERLNGCVSGLNGSSNPYYGARILDVMATSLMSNSTMQSIVSSQLQKSSGKKMRSILCNWHGKGSHKFKLNSFRDKVCEITPGCC